MRIDYPQSSQEDQLQALWKQAFGDEADFLELFFYRVFSPDRCRCVSIDGRVAAALYWLDCRCDGRPMAYLYAVATEDGFRRRGLCRVLMEDTHRLLQSLGYSGSLLVPGSRELRKMYARMGYSDATAIREFECEAGPAAALEEITPAQYARLRREMLPARGVIQEGENLTFLGGLTRFYRGSGFIVCAAKEEGRLFAPELLGSSDAAPGIAAALGCGRGTFRTPGSGTPFAMYLPLSDAPAPEYFAFAFD